MNKEDILKRVEDLTSQQLGDFIKQNIVTLEELRKTGNLDKSKRIEIKKYINSFAKEEEDAWGNAKYSNESVLRNFISKYPNGKYVEDAKKLIDKIEQEKEQNKGQKQKILNEIRRNPNSYSPNEIISFLGKSTITEKDLIDYCNIPKSAIDNLDKIITPVLALGKTPDEIPSGFTEVYFWGSPGSGKTCALGAILHVAENQGYLNLAAGSGLNYASRLKNIFSDNNEADDFLPAPSPVETTQYIPFTLKKQDEKNHRSVSLIELSGEIFECFYYHNAGLSFPSQSHQDSFNSLNKFLESENRKIHFFFIDYDKNNKPDQKNGLKQSDYLTAASNYFKNNNVFSKTTDAIYIMLTKSDLLLDDNDNFIEVYEERVAHAVNYLNKNYKAFINTLKDINKKHDINGGRLLVEPFSLGKVYFKEICDFNSSAASKVVNILVERIRRSNNNILNVFNR